MGSVLEKPFTILLLAGTAEARELAGLLAAGLPESGLPSSGQPESGQPAPKRAIRVIASLAGATATPSPLGVETRIGGFGGASGLAGYLREAGIDAVVDATHPFAARITANAVEASATCGVRCLRLERPAWERLPGDDWRSVATLAQASGLLPAGARAFLAVGRQEIGVFAGRRDVHFVMRMIDPPAGGAVRPPGEIVLARPNPEVEAEVRLLREHAITHVVAKNSGGMAGRAKIDAARTLGLPVFMVSRPQGAGGPLVTNAGEAVRWLETLLAASQKPGSSLPGAASGP